MKIIVLGSSGFIGSHVAEYLKQFTEYTVFEADIAKNQSQERYIQIIPSADNFDYIFSHEFDVCVNCTGAAHVGNSMVDPQNDFSLNAENVFRMLDSILRTKNKCAFFNMSSAAVYGNPKNLPVAEEANAHPISPYGYHKFIAEQIQKEYANIYEIPSRIIRIFSCYGPRLKKQLFWDSYKKFKLNDFTFRGTGEESRDFVYVKDVARAIELIIRKDNNLISTYNIGSGRETTVKHAINTFANVCGINCEIMFSGEKDRGQPSNWCSDITKALTLGFVPEYSLQDGLMEYFQWIKNAGS